MAAGPNDELRPSCARHPAARAGWRCRDCGAALCPDCAGTRNAGTTSSYVVCATCGGAAPALVAPRARLRPFVARLREAPAFPLTASVGVSVVLLAAFRTLLSYRGFAPVPAQVTVAGASAGAFWAYVFYVIRHTATGQLGLVVPDFRDVKEDLFAPAIKGIVATSLIWAPSVLYLLATNGWDFLALTQPRHYADPVIALLVLAGLAYCPMALIAAATDVELADMLNPVQIVRFILKGGRDYAVLVGALLAMAIPGALVQLIVVPGLRELPVPFLCRWLGEIAGLYVPFVMARMLGTFLYVHGHALDWGSPADYDEPILPGVLPRGTAPPANAPLPPVPLESPVAESPRAPTAGEPDELVRALATKDLARALALYEAGPPAAGALGADHHFAVGSAAANEGRFPLAVRALKAAAFASHEVAPRALITLARVYEEGLRDPDAAARLYHEACKRFPDTPAAAFARERLARG